VSLIMLVVFVPKSVQVLPALYCPYSLAVVDVGVPNDYHSISNVTIGTMLLWFGWLGSTFAANLKADLAIANTNLAGSMAGLTWIVMDAFNPPTHVVIDGHITDPKDYVGNVNSPSSASVHGPPLLFSLPSLLPLVSSVLRPSS